MHFPLWQYLTQPVFDSQIALILNPIQFWQVYQVQNLEACWQIDPVQQLESCWQKNWEIEESIYHFLKDNFEKDRRVS